MGKPTTAVAPGWPPDARHGPFDTSGLRLALPDAGPGRPWLRSAPAGWGAVAPQDALTLLDTGDAGMRHLLGRLRKVIDKPIAVVLQGESGVGKDVLARALHDSSARRQGPYVAVNCAALPEGLIEAELFGYRGGAFTGAAREGAPGRLRQAHGGTLFLDEIGDMPLALQARLLRVLQDRQVQPLGGGAAVTVDVQLVCASHRPLQALVAQGRFRDDLYYRINGLAVTVPPLRLRTDLPQLVQVLLDRLAPGRLVAIDPALLGCFAAYGWPGNIRQLEQALRVGMAMMEPGETVLMAEHLPDELQDDLGGLAGAGGAGGGPGAAASAASAALAALAEWAAGAASPTEPPASRQPQDAPPDASPAAAAVAAPDVAGHRAAEALRPHALTHARRILADCGGNISEAARRLGIGRNTLYRMLRACGSAAHGQSCPSPVSGVD